MGMPCCLTKCWLAWQSVRFIDRVLVCLAACSPLVNALDDNGMTPLHHAVWFGRYNVVSLLCTFDPDLEAGVLWEGSRGVVSHSRS